MDRLELCGFEVRFRMVWPSVKRWTDVGERPGTNTMTERLVEHNGERAGLVHPLGSPARTIGRDEDNDIVIPSDHVSRHHARVERDGARWVLYDLGSKNGTFLNGCRVTTPRPLQQGDIVALPGLILRFDEGRGTVTWKSEAAPAGWLRIELSTAEVWVDGAHVHLTAKEYRALCLLDGRRGALVTKDELAAWVWPEYHGDVSDDNIERLMSRLRQKLRGSNEQPRLVTVRALGYRLVRGEHRAASHQ